MTVKLQLQNKIINGCLEYWQRGTSFPAIADVTYFADRFLYAKVGTMVHTASRSTDVPSASSNLYSMNLDCTTIDASIASNDYAAIAHRVEGNFLRSFKGKKMVLVFWVKATKTGVYCVSFRNHNATRSLIKQFTVNQSEVWEKKTIRFQHDPSGSWLYDNGRGLEIWWALAAGATYQTSADVWTNGNFLATANQVNACDNVANNFQLTDICLVEDNEGQTRDPEFQLAGKDIFEELKLCQRYFERVAGLSSYNNLTTKLLYVSYLAQKRVSPAIVISAISAGSTNGDHPYTPTVDGFGASFSGAIAGDYHTFTYTADAEL